MISLENGKYTLIVDDHRGIYKCLRYNLDWRDVTGDKLILALYDKVEELQRKIATYENQTQYHQN